MPNADKPKSNMEIAVDALKAEIAAEVTKPTPSWVKISKLTSFLQSQRLVPDLADAVREEIAAEAARSAQGIAGYAIEDDDSDDDPLMPHARMRRAFTQLPPISSAIPQDVKNLIDKVIDISPFQADKAKKMLECAGLLVNCAVTFEPKEKADSVFEFAQKLRDKAMDILRPEFGEMSEVIKPAIRHLDLNDSEEIDAEFEAK